MSIQALSVKEVLWNGIANYKSTLNKCVSAPSKNKTPNPQIVKNLNDNLDELQLERTLFYKEVAISTIPIAGICLFLYIAPLFLKINNPFIGIIKLFLPLELTAFGVESTLLLNKIRKKVEHINYLQKDLYLTNQQIMFRAFKPNPNLLNFNFS